MKLLEHFLLDLTEDRGRFAGFRLGDSLPPGEPPRRLHLSAASGAWREIPDGERPEEWAEVALEAVHDTVRKIEAWFYFAGKSDALTALNRLRRVWRKSSAAQVSGADETFEDRQSVPPRRLHTFAVWKFSPGMDPEDEGHESQENPGETWYCVQLILTDSSK